MPDGAGGLFVQGSLDQFGPVNQLEVFFSSLAEPKELVIIEGADHFFEGHLAEMSDTVRQFVEEQQAE